MSYAGLGTTIETYPPTLLAAARCATLPAPSDCYTCPPGTALQRRFDGVPPVCVTSFTSTAPPALIPVPGYVRPSPWASYFTPLALAFYGIVGLGVAVGTGVARRRGKSWTAAAGYGVAGGVIAGGGTIMYALRNYG